MSRDVAFDPPERVFVTPDTWSPSSLDSLRNPFEWVLKRVIGFKDAKDARPAPLEFGTLWGQFRHLHDLSRVEALGEDEPFRWLFTAAPRMMECVGLCGNYGPGALKRAALQFAQEVTPAGDLYLDEDGWSCEKELSTELTLNGETFHIRAIFDSFYLRVEDGTRYLVASEKKAKRGRVGTWDIVDRKESIQVRIQEYLAWAYARSLDLPLIMELEFFGSYVTKAHRFRQERWMLQEEKVMEIPAKVAGEIRLFQSLRDNGLLTREAWIEGSVPFRSGPYDAHIVKDLYRATPSEREAWLQTENL